MFGKKKPDQTKTKISKIFGATSSSTEKPIKTKDESEDWLSDYEGQLAIDVYQTDEDVIVKAPIAGVKPEDLDVSITDGVLTIKGQRTCEEKVREENYFAQECYWGAFARSFTLPSGLDPENTSASLKNGVLTIRIPKEEKSKTRKIDISTE